MQASSLDFRSLNIMTPLNKILNALREHGSEPRLSGNDWMCRCPAHDDSTQSLSITRYAQMLLGRDQGFR